jgi:hypothetical protein
VKKKVEGFKENTHTNKKKEFQKRRKRKKKENYLSIWLTPTLLSWGCLQRRARTAAWAKPAAVTAASLSRPAIAPLPAATAPPL